MKGLGRNQRLLLADLAKDGPFMPHANERKTADALAKRGLVSFDGLVARITDDGKTALSEKGDA